MVRSAKVRKPSTSERPMHLATAHFLQVLATMDEQSLIRNAISLNNIGVSLLSKRCFPQAASVLNDALFVMRMQATGHSKENEDVSGMMVKASKYLSSLHVCTKSSCGITVVPDSCDELPTVLRSVTSKRCFPIIDPLVVRIESGDSDGVSRIDMPCMSSIVTYNLAVSYLCMSELRSCRRKFMAESLRLLGVANFSLSLCEEEEQEAKVMMLSLVVTSLIAEVLYMMGHVPQAMDFAFALGHMQKIAEEYVSVYQTMCPVIRHASAA